MTSRPYCGTGPRPYSPRTPNLVWSNVHGPSTPQNQHNWNRPNHGPRGGCPPFQPSGPRWPPPVNSGPFQQNKNNYHGGYTGGGGNFYGNRGPGPNHFRHNGPINTNNQSFQNHDCSQSNLVDNKWQSFNPNTDNSFSGTSTFNHNTDNSYSGPGGFNQNRDNSYSGPGSFIQNTDNSYSGTGGFSPGYRGNGRGGFQRGRGRGQGQHNQFSQGKQKKKKEPKPDKRDLPENNKFFCDTCDRGFPTEDKFQEHSDQHQQCSYDGCSYIAAPKLVQMHIQLQHKSGLAKKVWSVESQDDINKWREERKKNFPTSANIEKKKALLEERKSRGEVLQNKYFGKMKGREYNKQNIDLNNDQKGNRKRHQSAEGDEAQKAKKNKQEPSDQTSEDEHSGTDSKFLPGLSHSDKVFMTPEIKKAIKARNRARAKAKKTDKEEHWSSFRLIRNKVNKMIVDKKEELGIETCRVRRRERDTANRSIDSIEDESLGGNNAGERNKEKSLKEDDDKKDVEGPEEQSILKVNVLDPGLPANQERCDGLDLPTEATLTNGHAEDVMDKGKNPRTRNRRPKKHEPRSNIPAKKKKTSSLLEKLLANDIRHERNVILQCVHYVVKNNYFGVGQSSCDLTSTNGKLSCDQLSANDNGGQLSCKQSVINGEKGQLLCDLSLSNGHSAIIDTYEKTKECIDLTCDTESAIEISVNNNNADSTRSCDIVSTNGLCSNKLGDNSVACD